MSPKVVVQLGRAAVHCDIALTPHEQRVGLERYASLHDGDALIFPFSPARYATFHAGRVTFPFDVVFVGLDRRIAKIEHDIEPGDPSMWSFGPCTAVIETPGGFCHRHDVSEGDQVDWDDSTVAQSQTSLWDRFGSLGHVVGKSRLVKTKQSTTAAFEGYSADPSATEPGDHSLHDVNQWQDRDPDVTKSDPNATDNPIPGFEQQLGYDQANETFADGDGPAVRPARASLVGLAYRSALHKSAQGINGAELPTGEIVDPVAYATHAIQAIAAAARAGDSLQWRGDPLNPLEEYAYVNANTIQSWMDHVGVGDVPSIVSAAQSTEGMDILAETLMLGEVASRTRFSPDGKTLILYRTVDQPEVKHVEAQATTTTTVGPDVTQASPDSVTPKNPRDYIGQGMVGKFKQNKAELSALPIGGRIQLKMAGMPQVFEKVDESRFKSLLSKGFFVDLNSIAGGVGDYLVLQPNQNASPWEPEEPRDTPDYLDPDYDADEHLNENIDEYNLERLVKENTANLSRIYELEYTVFKLSEARKSGPLADRAERELILRTNELSRRLDEELTLLYGAFTDWMHEAETKYAGSNDPRIMKTIRGVYKRLQRRDSGANLKDKIVLMHEALTTAHHNASMGTFAYGLGRGNGRHAEEFIQTLLNELSANPDPMWDEEMERLIGLPRGGSLRHGSSLLRGRVD